MLKLPADSPLPHVPLVAILVASALLTALEFLVELEHLIASELLSVLTPLYAELVVSLLLAAHLALPSRL